MWVACWDYLCFCLSPEYRVRSSLTVTCAKGHINWYCSDQDRTTCRKEPIEMVPSCSLVICPPKTLKPHWPLVAPASRKLWFLKAPNFGKSTQTALELEHMSKVTIRCHKRCLQLSWVQIWQKNSNGKCPKLPITDFHALCHKVV